VLIRAAAGALAVVRSSLRPVLAPAVAVRSAAGPASTSERFELSPLAAGAVLVIASEAGGFRLTVAGGEDAEVDWYLTSEAGRRDVTQIDGEPADLSRVEPGRWMLGRSGVEAEVLLDLKAD